MREMRQSSLAWLFRLLSSSARTREIALGWALRLEGGQIYSRTARWILANYYRVSIGDYSYGACFLTGAFPPGVSIGRYVSVGPNVRAFLRNHPADRLSMHPFFYNRNLGFVKEDTISSGTLEIGHDTWIGAQTVILSGCSRIGLGVVIGAGSVVTKDIPDFSIAAGNPARVIRTRFPEELCQKIRESRWWERPASECAKYLEQMTGPLTSGHPLLSPENPVPNAAGKESALP